MRLNERRVRRGEIRQEDIRLKDPRTGQDFNPTFALRSLYHPRPTRETLKGDLRHRIPGITAEEVDAFVTETDDCSMNIVNFVNQIKSMANLREINRLAYERHISHLQNAAASQFISPSHPPLPPSSTPNSSSIRDPQLLAEATIVIDGESVLSDSDSLFDRASINVNLNTSDYDSDDSVSLPPVNCTPIRHREPTLNNTPPMRSEPIADVPPINYTLPPPLPSEPIASAPPTNSALPPPLPSEPFASAPPTNSPLPPPTPTTSIRPAIPNVTQLSQASLIPIDANSVRGTIS